MTERRRAELANHRDLIDAYELKIKLLELQKAELRRDLQVALAVVAATQARLSPDPQGDIGP